MANPTYHNLGDHAETLQVDYDPAKLNYEELLRHFFSEHRPVRPPYSRQYMSAVFCADQEECESAEKFKALYAQRWDATIYTEIAVDRTFYRAEDYHQKYRMQRSRELSAFYQTRYGTTKAFVDAPTTARINAYLGGILPRTALDGEIQHFDLPEQLVRVLQKSVG